MPVFDGERVLFLDWDAAGANDPFYDLATVAVFLHLDDATSAQLIAAHDQAPVAAQLPSGRRDRRARRSTPQRASAGPRRGPLPLPPLKKPILGAVVCDTQVAP